MKCPIRNQNCSNQCALSMGNGKCAVRELATTTSNLAEAVFSLGRKIEAVDKRIDGASESVDDLAIMAAELSDLLKGKQSAPAAARREANDGEIERFCQTVNIGYVVNCATKSVYEELFVPWCGERQVLPCSAKKLTTRMAEAKGLKVKAGKYCPIGAAL